MKKHQFIVSVPVQKGLSANMVRLSIRDALKGHGDFFGQRCSVIPAQDMPQEAALWRQVRDLPAEQLGVAGVPCLAVPCGATSGTYVSGPDADEAMAKWQDL